METIGRMRTCVNFPRQTEHCAWSSFLALGLSSEVTTGTSYACEARCCSCWSLLADHRSAIIGVDETSARSIHPAAVPVPADPLSSATRLAVEAPERNAIW